VPVQRSIPRTVLAATLTILSVVAVIALVWLLRKPISWIVVATFIAVALAAPVEFFARRLPRGLAITLVYLLLLLIPAGVGAIVVPPVVTAAGDLVDEAPTYARQLQHTVEGNKTLTKLDDDFQIVDQIQAQADKLPAKVGDAASWLGDLGLGIVNSAFAAITILILSMFLVANGRRWVDAALDLGPPERAARIKPVLDRMASAVGAYIAGALLQAIIAGVLTWIVLTVLGVPFAAPLAVLVGLFDLIPMVGATIGAVVVGIVTLFHDFPTATIIWVVWSVIYQQLENTVIQPRIQNRAVGVHAFVVMVAVLCGGTLLGIPGALLAVPVAASIQLGVQAWWGLRAYGIEPAVTMAQETGEDVPVVREADDGPGPGTPAPA
jgi:predicted PurR-regulated permease PerM